MRAAALAAALTLSLAAPALSETRCGWVDNPTPGNWFLEDRHASWALGLQGADLRNNWLDIEVPEFAGWVRTNGYYGYGCGCFEGSVNWQAREAAWIERVWSIPLSRCYGDPALPQR